ncbi:MAG: hypothetical protein RR382_00755 [Tannerellaceae bacterium]
MYLIPTSVVLLSSLLLNSVSSPSVPVVQDSPQASLPVTEVCASATDIIPRGDVSIDFSITPGTLYSMTNVQQWREQIATYLTWTDLTVEEVTMLSSYDEMCDSIEAYVNYQAKTNETIPQMLARVVTKEIGGLTDVKSYSTANMEKAAVVWCILNRVDGSGNTSAAQVVSITKAPYQFAYVSGCKIFDGLEALCVDVLIRWRLETIGLDAGRTLPAAYKYFGGNGKHNIFRQAYSTNSTKWDWSLPDPYKK